MADLRADSHAMLSHQLPELPPVDDFMATLDDVFAWLEGTPVERLTPIPVGREQLERGWVPPPTITRWPGGAPFDPVASFLGEPTASYPRLTIVGLGRECVRGSVRATRSLR
jgi:hypothetical protein